MKSFFSSLKSAFAGPETSRIASPGDTRPQDVDQKQSATDEIIDETTALEIGANSAPVAGQATTLAALAGFLGDQGDAPSAPPNPPFSGAQYAFTAPPDAVSGHNPAVTEDIPPAQIGSPAMSPAGVPAASVAGDPAGTASVQRIAVREPDTLDGTVEPVAKALAGGGEAPAAPADARGSSQASGAEIAATADSGDEGNDDLSGGDEGGDDAESASGDIPNTPGLADGGSVSETAAAGTTVATLQSDGAVGDNVIFTLTDSAGTPLSDSNFEIVGNEIRVKPGSGLDFEADTSLDVYVVATGNNGNSAPLHIAVTVTDAAEDLQLADGGVAFTDIGVAETSVTGGDGDDTIVAHADGGTLNGGAGDDTLTGGAGDDSLDGGTGDDTLTGGTGDDRIDGGDGIDEAVYEGDLSDFRITYDSANDSFTVIDNNAGDGLDEGTDIVTNVENFTFGDQTYTKAEMQTEAARQANRDPSALSMASGGTINETVADGGTIASANDLGGQTVATLATTDADAGDTHTYSIVSDPSGKFEILGDAVRVKAGETIDYESVQSFDVTVRSTDQHGASVDKQLTFTVQDFEGNYTAGNGNETITGSSEEDTITGGNGTNVINAGAGDDVIIDGAGADTIDGGEGSDTIHLEDLDYAQSNVITDTGTSGTDRLILDRGNGTYRVQGDFSAATSGIEEIDGSASTGEVFGTQDASASFDFTGITLTGVDRIEGTDAADTIVGSAQADTIHGLAGNDTLNGAAGDDVLAGGVGDDTLTGGTGDDRLTGDTGTNYIVNGSFEDISGASQHYYGRTKGSVEGWTDANGHDFQMHWSGYHDVESTDGDYWLDTMADGGDHMDISQSVAGLQDGAKYQLSFDAAEQMSYLPGQMDVYFGGEKIATINPGEEDVMQSYTFDIVGGSGDGSDVLRFDTSSSNGNIGLSLDNVKIVDAGEDTLRGGDGNDTLDGGGGDDRMFGGDGDDAFLISAMQGDDVVSGGSGWTDAIELQGFSGTGVSIVNSNTGTSIDGAGWTMTLDAGHSVASQSPDALVLSDDASGVITFDTGGTVQFAGIETVNW